VIYLGVLTPADERSVATCQQHGHQRHWNIGGKARAYVSCVTIFLESYVRFLTYETLSYVNHIVANILGLVYATITHLNDTELEKNKY